MLRSARTAGVTVTTFMPPSTATFSASVVGKSVTASRALRLSPPWRKLTVSVSPGPVSSMTASQSRNVRNRRPRALTSTSPAARPARPAGPPAATCVTRKPPTRFHPRRSSAPATSSPTQARRTFPNRRSSSATRRARSIGIANPIPPDQQVGALAERRGRKTAPVHFEHGDVRERVLAQDLGRKVPAFARRDDDLLGPLCDVLVGDHDTVRRDDEARPIALHHLFRAAG